jgi:HNH endonuclease
MIKKFSFPVYYSIEINDKIGVVKVISNSKHAKGRELSQYYSPDGYLRVKMNNKNYSIHGLVAELIIGKRPENMVVNHKDGNKTNNRPSNLEYVTIAENIKHAVKFGMHVSSNPERSGRYIDGRALDHNKYKKEWYLKNKANILKKAKDRYQAKVLVQKEGGSSLI